MATEKKKNKTSKSAQTNDAQIIRRQVTGMVLILALIGGGYWLWRWGEMTGWGNPDRAVKLSLERAQKAVVARSLDRAVEIYADLLERYPEHPDTVQALTQLAGAYHELKDYPAAIKIYTALLERLKSDPAKKDLRAFTLLQIAKLHREKGDSPLALENLNRVRARFPGTDWSGEAQSEIGAVYYDRGEYLKAIEAYQVVIKELPKGFLAAEAQGKIGECYEQLDDISGAMLAYQKVVDEYPSAVWDPAKERIEFLKKKLELQEESKDKRG